MRKKIYDYSSRRLEEMFLMALTYRLSLRNFCLMFNCTIDDLKIAINRIDYLTTPMFLLDKATINQSEEAEKYSVMQAKSYWDKREKINEDLKSVQLPESKTVIKEILKNHLLLIDETNIKKIIRKLENNNLIELSPSEKDAIAEFRVKYSYSLRQTAKIMHTNDKAVLNYCNDYAKRNKIYAEQLEALNDIAKVRANEFLRNTR